MSDRDLHLWDEQVWEIYDPNTAQIRGLFYDEKDARLFMEALRNLKAEQGDMA